MMSSKKLKIIFLVVNIILIVIIGLSFYLYKYFGPVSMDQLIYHSQAGGLNHAAPKLLRNAAIFTILTLSVISLVSYVIVKSRYIVSIVFSVVFFPAAFLSLDKVFMPGCDQAMNKNDYIKTNYSDPAKFLIHSSKPPPDILIVFVESLESTYSRANIFGKNLIPELTKWRDSGANFGEFHAINGASWTMGGVFSALCGLPLKPVGLQTGNNYQFSENFLSKGKCLTDLLAEKNYEISFFKGASLIFAGFDKFLLQHKSARNFGYEQFFEAGLVKSKENGWGINDSTLFEIVFNDIKKRGNNPKPKLDMVLTVNTHPPAGIVDKNCHVFSANYIVDERDPDMRKLSYQCADIIISNFINMVEDLNDNKERIILVMGDHLAMRSTLDTDLMKINSSENRQIFIGATHISSSGKRMPIKISDSRSFTHLDIYPTVMQIAGFRWGEHKRIALGRSLLETKDNDMTLVERDGFDQLNKSLSCRSAFFESLW